MKHIIKGRDLDLPYWISNQDKLIELLLGSCEAEIIYKENGEEHYILLSYLQDEVVNVKGILIKVEEREV